MQSLMTTLILALLLILQIGCLAHVDKQDLYGHYEARTRNATATLILKRDMTYQQEVRFDNGDRVEAQGRWKYPSDLDDDKVELFDLYLLESDHVRRTHDYAIPVNKSLGIVELEQSPGTGISYRRLATEK